MMVKPYWVLSTCIFGVLLFWGSLAFISIRGDVREQTARSDACEERAKVDRRDRQVEGWKRECREMAEESKALINKMTYYAPVEGATRAGWEVSYEACLERKSKP